MKRGGGEVPVPSILLAGRRGLRALGTALSAKGMEVRHCPSRQVLPRLEGIAADVVLLADEPSSPAPATLAALKARFPEVPVVCVGNGTDPAGILQILRAGAREYFAAPVDVEALCRIVTGLARLRSRSGAPRESLGTGEGRGGAERGGRGGSLPVRIANVLDFMERNLATALSLDDLAARAAMSRYHFCRTFRRHLGVPPYRYLSTLRVEEAKVLLRRGGMTVTDVAEAVGFSDLSNFTKAFRAATGMNPRTFKDSSTEQIEQE